MLVREAVGVADVARAISRAPLVAFDLEFDSRDTRIPVLCLVQVGWLTGGSDAPDAVSVALIDPILCDATPVVAALSAHPLVLAHAPRQDLGIIAARFGAKRAAMAGLVDTQLMAAFAGIGEQVGLAGLAQELLGVALDKEQQFTAWQTRPLTDAQLAYAEADVRYLPAMYRLLAAQLGPRLAWARAETAVIAQEAIAAGAPDFEQAWRDVSGQRGLDGTALGIVAVLATWRLRASVELDKPAGQVLSDKAIVELARKKPLDGEAVREVRGVSQLARGRADELAAVITSAVPRPAQLRGRGPSARAQRWADVLLAIAQLVAEDAGIATRLLATRSDAESFARAVDEGGLAAAAALPALASWRAELLGAAWRGFLTGQIVIAGDAASPNGLALRRAPQS
jgi:ribonuclease D